MATPTRLEPCSAFGVRYMHYVRTRSDNEYKASLVGMPRVHHLVELEAPESLCRESTIHMIINSSMHTCK
jgi:hypothetical protein